MTSLVLGPTRLREKNENYNILVLECIGRVDPNIVVMMTFKIMASLALA